MRAILLTVIFLAASFAASPVRAQDRSPIFTVPKVPVFAEAGSAAAAQAEAQAQGRRVAMDLLLRRLTTEDDWQYLPRLAADQPAPASAPDPSGQDAPYQSASAFPPADPIADALGPIARSQPVAVTAEDLPQLEQSFAVFDEKTSRTTYRATITYRFKPAEIRRLLSEARLPYSEAQSRQALVLPVLETEEGTYLWEAKNPWARAWLARPLDNELTPLLLPRGDARDVDAVTAPQALRLEAEALAALAERYGASQVVIAHGKLSEEDDQFRLYVRLIDGYLDGRGSNRRRIDAGNSRDLYDDAGGFEQGQRAAAASAGEPGGVLTEAFFRGRGDDFPALAQRAVESTVAAYARDWKERTLVDHSAVRRFELTAWFQGLEQWAEIRTALEATPLVQDMRTGVFNNENAVIDVSVIGDERQFALAMRQDGLTAWPSEAGWNIADANLAREVQARPEQSEQAERGAAGRGGLRRPYDAAGAPDVSYGTNPYGDTPAGGRTYGRQGYDDPEGDALPPLPDDLFGPAADEDAPREERSIDELLIEQL